MTQPTPTNHEIKLSKKRYIVSKTDTKGIIEYGNDYFTEISGYTQEEFIGKPHNLVRHPDMPRVIFKMMWERIKTGNNILAVVKNLSKDGSYYWVITEFEPKVDPVSHNIISHTAFRKAAPQKAIDTMIPIYNKLLELEEEGGVEMSEKFLRAYFENRDTSYDAFIEGIVAQEGFRQLLFTSFRKMFS